MSTAAPRLIALAALAVVVLLLVAADGWDDIGAGVREALPTLASVAVGFGLSESGTWWRASRSDKRQRAAVRALLRI